MSIPPSKSLGDNGDDGGWPFAPRELMAWPADYLRCWEPMYRMRECQCKVSQNVFLYGAPEQQQSVACRDDYMYGCAGLNCLGCCAADPKVRRSKWLCRIHPQKRRV